MNAANNRPMQKITVIGAGMGAISAIRALRKSGYQNDIEVIAPSKQFLYYPSLIWIPTAKRKWADLLVDMTPFFKRYRVTYVQATAMAVKDGGRLVEHSTGLSHNDGLIIAAGARVLKKLPGVEHAFLACADAEKLVALQQRLSSLSQGKIAFGFAGNPNEATAMRGGPIFEMMFGIDSWLREKGKREAFELSFFSPAAEPGKRLGAQALNAIFAEMKTRNITTVLGQKITQFTDGSVQTEQQTILADCIVFQPGLTGPDFAMQSELPLSPAGFIKADSTCKIDGLSAAYVIGDAGVYDDSDWYPKQGHMADLHGKVAAANLFAYAQNRVLEHRVEPELLCIIDMHNDAILVKRRADDARATHNWIYHYAKIAFEKYYLWRLRLGF